jgi:MscS family membrane protein
MQTLIKYSLAVILLGNTWLLPHSARAQDSLELYSPYHTLYTFLYNLNDDSYDPDKAARVIYDGYATRSQAKKLVIELKQVLDGKGLWIDLAKVPTEPNYLDSAANMLSHYQVNPDIPEVYLERIGDNWYFSKATTDQIDVLHKKLFPFGTDKLLNLLPKAGNYKILGIKMWQYLGILFVVIVSFVFHKIIRVLITTFLSGLLKKYGSQKTVIERIRPAAISGSQ